MFGANLLKQGAKFFATELTRKITFRNNLSLPSVGALAESLKVCSGVQPVVITKPNPFILELIVNKIQV